MFDRPISTGFTLFSSRYDFDQSRQASIALGQSIQLNPNTVQNYTQDSDGLTIFASYPMRKFGFTRVGLTYGLTNTTIKSLSTASTALFNVLQFQNLQGPSALTGILSSRLVPSLTYNTVDNPINPTHGKSLFYSVSLEGGPIGGNVNTVSNVAEIKYFHPTYHNRNVIGIRLTAAFETGFADKVIIPSSRYYLGGEDNLRGFDSRTVSPVAFIPVRSNTTIAFSDPTRLDASGNPTTRSFNVPTLTYQTSFPGGDTQGVFNFEYRIPVAPHVGLSLFADAGTTGALRHDQLQLNTTDYTTLVETFPTANLTNKLPFAPGTNFKMRSSVGVELVVQLPIVQAPFRIYWAYNLQRMSQVITAPATVFPGNPSNPNDTSFDGLKATLPPGVWDSQVLPALLNLQNNPQRTNFFDPIRTFRFTVSRTF